MRWFSFFLFLVLTQSLPADEDFQVQTTFESKEISIDQPLKLTILLTYKEGYQPDLYSLQKKWSSSGHFLGNAFTVSEMIIEDPKQVNGKLQRRILLTLQPLRIGDLSFTLFDVVFKAKEEKDNKVVITPVEEIKVFSIHPANDFIGYLSPVMSFSKDFPLRVDREVDWEFQSGPLAVEKIAQDDITQMRIKSLPWLPIGIFLLGALTVIAFVKLSPQIKPLSLSQQILLQRKAALEQIEKKSIDGSNAKLLSQIYEDFTETLRKYIETILQVPVTKLTTQEFLEQTSKDIRLSNNQREHLRSFLQRADLVKFGRYQPSVEECKEAKELAIKFIQS